MWTAGDGNFDGIVGLDDLNLVRNHFGITQAGARSAIGAGLDPVNTPESPSWFLAFALTIGAYSILRRP
jgi:hypothetical protein